MPYRNDAKRLVITARVAAQLLGCRLEVDQRHSGPDLDVLRAHEPERVRIVFGCRDGHPVAALSFGRVGSRSYTGSWATTRCTLQPEPRALRQSRERRT